MDQHFTPRNTVRITDCCYLSEMLLILLCLQEQGYAPVTPGDVRKRSFEADETQFL